MNLKNYILDIQEWKFPGRTIWIGQQPFIKEGQLEFTTRTILPEDYVGLIGQTFEGRHIYERANMIEEMVEEIQGLMALHEAIQREQDPLLHKEYTIEYCWRMQHYHKTYKQNPFYTELKR